MTERTKRALITGLYLVVGAFCIRAFFDVSSFYASFRPVVGLDARSVPPSELSFCIWFVFLGSLAAMAWSLGLERTSLPGFLQAAFARLTRRKWIAVVGLAVGVVLLSALFRALVLLDAPVADDESTYFFIAQTLRHGRLVNPLPAEPDLFAGQFIVMNHQGWFGKYPIGHPLLLMVADLVRARFFVGPLVTGLSLLVTYFIGKRVFGDNTAMLGILLLAISPHFLLTGATLLSQTTSTLTMLAGLYFTIRFMESDRSLWGALAGLLFAYGVLVRPLPGTLFFIAALAGAIFQPNGTRLASRLRSRGPGLLWFLSSGVLAVVLLLLVNLVQTGSVFKSGYHEIHGGYMGIRFPDQGLRSMSVAGALLRQNFWLFGWPISLAFICFIRRNRTFPLLVALLAAEYLYRVITPKTVVSSTGPVYVTEIVPLLALASASGMAEVKRWLEGIGIRRATSAMVSLATSFTVVGLLCFWPVQLISLGAGARQWRFPYRVLQERGVAKALVFADRMVNPMHGVTWAYWPPNPSPTVDDDILFVRIPRKSPDILQAMQELHGRRYPDRPAFVLQLEGEQPALVALPPAH